MQEEISIYSTLPTIYLSNDTATVSIQEYLFESYYLYQVSHLIMCHQIFWWQENKSCEMQLLLKINSIIVYYNYIAPYIWRLSLGK